MTQKCNDIVQFIQETYRTQEFIPLHEPRFRGNEKRYLNECIDSTFVSSVGKFVDRAEEDFTAFVGAKYAVATVNGTSALHVALLCAGVKNGDEVLTQALSFVATANAISYCGAKPIFLDVSRKSMGMSPEALENFLTQNCQIENRQCINKTTQKVIKACVPMHTFGHPCQIDTIAEICSRWHITLVEDAAESLGSYYRTKHTGTFGKLGCFSFNGNKIITAGGGGMIVTDDADLAQKAKHISTTAKVPHKWEYVHDMMGYNYRMPNLNAALLVAQLEELSEFLHNKRSLAEKYNDFFSKYDDIEFIKEPKGAQSNYWLNALAFQNKGQRDAFLECCNANNVMTRPIWQLLSELEIYRECQKDTLANSFALSETIVNIPSSVVL
ncbi:LegC family aminotransferase [Sulfurimonas paralvinellae]|uniref:GDP-perosamine synthase n=1 Tax=Sulfurimonas paralvinellae TaxID=317658 RepID=A0A7M1B5U0_9BACT|nr:LegC family aminotransferase [Sulfurimonas paralvinellae]QOP44886.1 LegC family aminotransferase [Sulfurimonas paralvinellae]